MSDKRPSHVVEQTGRNIDLAFQLFNEVIAYETSLDQIPNEGTIVLLPYDDQTLALKNLAMALRLASSGSTVYLRRIGAAPATNLSNLTQQDLLRWAAPLSLAGPRSIEYDPVSRAEVFDFSGGQRSTFRLPVSTDLALLVDINRREAVGFSVPEALTEHLGADQQEVTQKGYASDQGHRPDTAAAGATLLEDLALAAASLTR